jgi:hypothetical protein
MKWTSDAAVLCARDVVAKTDWDADLDTRYVSKVEETHAGMWVEEDT